MTEGRTMPLSPPVTTASEDSGESIDKFFDDVNQEHSVERGDNVLEETFAKDASEVIVEKTKKKQKRKVVRDVSGSIYPPKKLRDDYQSLLPNTSGKSLATLCGVVSEGFAIPSGVTVPLIATSVAPVLDVGPLDSVSGPNLRTSPPHVRSPVMDAPVVTIDVTTTVIADIAALPGSKSRDASKDLENIRDFASVGEANADATSISKLNKPSTLVDSFYASQSLDTETMHRIYVHRWKVTNDSIFEDPYVYRDLADRLAMPSLFAQLHTMDYDQLYSEFNVRDAWQVCLAAKVRMRTKHTLERKEAIRLRGQLTTVEAADVAKDSELKDLKEKNFFLEGERDVMSEKIATLESANAAKEAELASLSSQDEQTKILGDRVAELDAQLSKMAIHLDEEFYPRFLTTLSGRRWFLTHGLTLVLLKCLQSSEYLQALGNTIGCAVNKGIQDGLKAGINHGQACRDLSVIEAYDPSAEAIYIDVVNALGAVDFSLLSELESKKDSCIVDLIDSLRLDGILVEIPGAENLQPSPEQLMLPIHRPEDDIVIGETSLSSSLQVVNLRVQRFMKEVKEKRSLLTDVITPLVEPLSFKSLTGEASTSGASITTLPTTFASSDVVVPTSVVNDQVLDVKLHKEDPFVVDFEKEELGTSPE
nr:hypothetical protein [Tanacetum cinerariifolium]